MKQKKQKGFFIVLEGTDGSGKTEQFKHLLKRFRKEGLAYQTFDFPQYGQDSAYFVEEYLNGHYGSWQEVGPYRASIFYALDRFQASQKIRFALKQGKIVLANRYTASNLGHQGAKIKNKKERIKFFKWLYDIEYRILGIPEPDLNIFLHVPAKIAYQLVGRKGKREYLKGKKRDIHEQDLLHLQAAEKAYLEAVEMFNNFVLIECAPASTRVERGEPKQKLLSIEEIAEKIWLTVKKLIF